MKKEKSIEQKIAETENLLRHIIGNADLNVSIMELILRNVYTEIKTLADENIQSQIREYLKNKDNEEVEDGNTDEKG